jgi:hypothetical protein
MQMTTITERQSGRKLTSGDMAASSLLSLLPFLRLSFLLLHFLLLVLLLLFLSATSSREKQRTA